MHRIVLHPPEVSCAGAWFRWQIEPATPLYSAHSFGLRLPAGLDGRRLPEGFWWTVALLCLHSHWTLLRPCSVRLPVGLEPGHREFWLRLLARELTTLGAYRRGGGAERPAGGAASEPGGGLAEAPAGASGRGPGGASSIELLDDGPPLLGPAPLAEAGRCAAAFSGGKDSLLQAALLAELGLPAVLVTTTSPMHPLSDHVTPRRRQVLAEIAPRRDLEVVVLSSW
ncbi:MAG TPA: hypothetical protein VHR45_08560 [Thermoanaerobaculia bacterium]|nr:hypothetical protein [Thermoanaerobaculia bacterium]